MSDVPKTSMSLQNIASGFTMNLAAASGIVGKHAAVSALSGYDISKGTDSHGLVFDIVSVTGNGQVNDPPSIVVAVGYGQEEDISELDLDIRYGEIPDGTEIAVECTKPEFNISRQPISGSSLIGSSGKNLRSFNMTAAIKLWIANPDQLQKQSNLVLSMSMIDGASGGPVKKTVLEKIVVNLCP